MPHVLIVEDQPDVRDLVSAFLRSKGYHVTAAPDGHEAVRELSDQAPDAVILDVSMPGMDGIELLERIRSVTRWASLPVILLTAHGSERELDRARDLGVSAVLRKGAFRFSDLEQLLERILGDRRIGDGGDVRTPG